MPNSIINIVKSIKDSESAKLHASVLGSEPIHLDCVYKESESPFFFLVFPPETIPAELDINQTCSVVITSESNPVTLSASIKSINGDRTLEMLAEEAIDPASLREYFRVAYSMPITASFEPQDHDSSEKQWKIEGMTLDLSGTGLLGIFPQEFENNSNIFLEFTLEEGGNPIRCVARVVRTRRLRRERFQIALHFDVIQPEDRDAIITICLQEQRKQLRERIHNQ
ncbi:MAG: PilZ domain-containing protein [Desulfobacterales bacterium]|nr:PilZ domain-containing protein [Desulfobacterales bacterium]